MKRQQLSAIIHSHTVQAAGYHIPILRTGFESVVASRNTSTFASTAKQDGKVIKITDSGIVVSYKDGTTAGYPLGRIYGKAEGSTYPFDLITKMKEGQTFKEGAILSWNTSFFDPDPLNLSGVALKNSLTAKVALWETKQTHEDASAISEGLAARLGTRVTYVRNFTIKFNENLHQVVSPGQAIKPSDTLMIIEDEITSELGGFSAQSLETLKGLQRQAPKANYLGTVDRIEVYYHGDKDEMSQGLRALADRSDRQLAARLKSRAEPVYTGRVNDDWRVDGTPLAINKAEVKFFITVNTGMGVADKLVFANQMKSVNSEVMSYKLFAEDGSEIDAVFGRRSIAARNVSSPDLIGTTVTLVKLFTKEFIQNYRSGSATVKTP